MKRPSKTEVNSSDSDWLIMQYVQMNSQWTQTYDDLLTWYMFNRYMRMMKAQPIYFNHDKTPNNEKGNFSQRLIIMYIMVFNVTLNSNSDPPAAVVN